MIESFQDMGPRIGEGVYVSPSASAIGEGSLVATGPFVLEGTHVPPRSLVAGVPASVKRNGDEETVRSISERAEEYHRLALSYLEGREFVLPERGI